MYSAKVQNSTKVRNNICREVRNNICRESNDLYSYRMLFPFHKRYLAKLGQTTAMTWERWCTPDRLDLKSQRIHLTPSTLPLCHHATFYCILGICDWFSRNGLLSAKVRNSHSRQIFSYDTWTHTHIYFKANAREETTWYVSINNVLWDKFALRGPFTN